MEIEGINVCNVVKVENEEYTPYGETWIQEESSSNNMNYITYKFTSKELDEETGLYYFGQRYYDAQTSRWISADPIYDGVRDGLGVFTYCRNNPLIYTDPTGLAGETTPNTEKDVPGLPGNYRDTEKNHRGNKTQAPVPDNKNKTDIIGGSPVTVITPNAPGTSIGSGSGSPGTSNPSITGIPKASPGSGNPSIGTGSGNGAGIALGALGRLALILGLLLCLQGDTDTNAKKWREEKQNKRNNSERVYRIFGNRAKLYGRSWTPIDPRTIKDYRDEAGLPILNSGKYIAEGILIDRTGVIVREALELDGNKGGLIEYLVPDPKNQIEIISVKKLTPKM